MIEAKAVSVHYVKKDPVCAYKEVDGGCDGEADIIRVTLLTDGSTHVSLMCNRHHIGEKETCISDGMVLAGQSSVAGAFTDALLIDEAVAMEVAQAVKRAISEEEE